MEGSDLAGAKRPRRRPRTKKKKEFSKQVARMPGLTHIKRAMVVEQWWGSSGGRAVMEQHWGSSDGRAVAGEQWRGSSGGGAVVGEQCWGEQ